MKVPLLEYLDKLEAEAKRDISYCANPVRCSEHHQVPVRLALIAKLREAIHFVSEGCILAANHGGPANLLNEFQDRVVAWANIEVPE